MEAVLTWINVQNNVLYTYLIVKRVVWDYCEYKEESLIKIDSYNRGYNSRPLVFFVFLLSCYLFTWEHNFFIDYDSWESWSPKHIVKDYDPWWYKVKPWYETAFFDEYYVYNRYIYTQQGDWGLPFDFKLHQFLIILWWIWLFAQVLSNLFNHIKYFIYE